MENEAYMVGSFSSTWKTPSDDRHSGEGGFAPERIYVHTTTSWAPTPAFFMRLKQVIFTLLFRGISLHL